MWSATKLQAPSMQPTLLSTALALLLVLWRQSHLECRLWNEIFVDAQKDLGIPNGELSRQVGEDPGGSVQETHARPACKRHGYCLSD